METSDNNTASPTAAAGQPETPAAAAGVTDPGTGGVKRDHKVLLAKVRSMLTEALRIHGAAATARWLGVNVDTVYTWSRWEHIPRDLHALEIKLDWLTTGDCTWERAMISFMREFVVEKDERRRVDILNVLMLEVAMVFRQHGYTYDYRVRPQNRASLTISSPYLEPCKVTFSRDQDLSMHVHVPKKGSKRFWPQPSGMLSVLRYLRELQLAEMEYRKYELSFAAADDRILAKQGVFPRRFRG